MSDAPTITSPPTDAARSGAGAELTVLRAVTTRLPRYRPSARVTFRGVGRLAYALKRWYLRKRRGPVRVGVLGFRMLLDPHDLIGGELLFVPQWYDPDEIAFLRHTLRPGDCFCDVGANIGFYSLVASGLVGPSGRVIAIEADPRNYADLVRNIGLSRAANVEAIHGGASDRQETLRLQLNTTGNRGGHTFLDLGRPEGVEVACRPLAGFLGDVTPTAMKLDIEGFEHRVLRAYLADTAPGRWPRHVIVERPQPTLDSIVVPEDCPRGDPERLLEDAGYRVVLATTRNSVLSRPA